MDGNLSNYSCSNDTKQNYSYEYPDWGEPVFLCDTDYTKPTSSATAVCYVVIFCFSITGNILVLCALIRYETLKKVTNLFVLNLAVSDLVFAFSLPFWITDHFSHWVFGDFLCKVVSGLYFISIYSNVMFLMVMTIERYAIIVHNQLVQHRKRLTFARGACAVIWVLSIFASLREMVISKTMTFEGSNFCEPEDSQKVDINYYLHICFLFILPLVVIVFCYSQILKTVMFSRNKNKRRTMALIFTIVMTFFVCRAPYNVMMVFMRETAVDCGTKKRKYLAFVVFRILAYSHCCLNPLLYAFTEKFRKHVASLLTCSPSQQTSNIFNYSAAHSSNVIEKAVVRFQ